MCRELDVFPKFLNFRLPNHVFSQADVSSLRREALFRELRRRERDLQSCQQRFAASCDVMRSRLSLFRYAILSSLLGDLGKQRGEQWRRILDRKLTAIWTSQRPSAPCTALRNISDYQLSRLEQRALRLGLDFCVVPPSVDNIGIQIALEKFARFGHSKVPDNKRSSFTSSTRHFMQMYMTSSYNLCNNISNKSMHKTLRNLKRNSNLKVCRFDKGSRTLELN